MPRKKKDFHKVTKSGLLESDEEQKCFCGQNTKTIGCFFPLHGSKEGEFCNRPLCDECGVMIEEKIYCRAHARMISSDLAK